MSTQNIHPRIIQLDTDQVQSLQAGVVHLYVQPISAIPHDEAELISYLNPEEQARARRFINPEHSQNFRRVRGLLRLLLAKYLSTSPAALEFSYAKHGKPSLPGNLAIHFNISHSRDTVAYVFSRDYEVGVDIEYMRAQKDLHGMMQHVGSVKEQAELQGLPDADALDAFYRLWTRKEAFIKAVGRGLGMGLRSIHIGINASDAPLAVEYKNETLPGWFVQDIMPPQDYKLALCTRNSALCADSISCLSQT